MRPMDWKLREEPAPEWTVYCCEYHNGVIIGLRCDNRCPFPYPENARILYKDCTYQEGCDFTDDIRDIVSRPITY